MLTKKEQKNASIFFCEKCNFKCCKKSNYEKHLSTRKHNILTFLTEKEQKMPHYICHSCDKEYKSREGLWYHKKKCIDLMNEEEDVLTKDDKIDILIKENMDFKNTLYKINKLRMFF